MTKKPSKNGRKSPTNKKRKPANTRKGRPPTTEELAKLVVSEGLNKDLLPGVDPSNLAACMRKIGVTLTPYDGELFTAITASEKITFRLRKKEDRWDGPKSSPQRRYIFEEVKREAVTKDDLSGSVLEEDAAGVFGAVDAALDDFKPEDTL
jgi:hypothetical protein